MRARGWLVLTHRIGRARARATCCARSGGIGPWTAEGILTRGTGIADALSVNEPDVLHAVQRAYGLARAPTPEELVQRAEAWRPYRAWVMVLVTADYHRSQAGDGPPRRTAIG